VRHHAKVRDDRLHRASDMAIFRVFKTVAIRHFGFVCNAWFLEPTRAHIPNDISISSAVFAQLTAECAYTLRWTAPSPLKSAPFP